MGPGNFFHGGFWIIPLIMIILFFILFKLKVFGKRSPMAPWQNSSESGGENKESETALDILNKRYAKGEITKNEFEQMKSDLQS